MKKFIVIGAALSLATGLAREGEILEAGDLSEDLLNSLVSQGKLAAVSDEALAVASPPIESPEQRTPSEPVSPDEKADEKPEPFLARLSVGLGPAEGWEAFDLENLPFEELAELRKIKAGEVPYLFDGQAVEKLTVKEILDREAALTGEEPKRITKKAEAIEALQEAVKQTFAALTLDTDEE